MPRWDFDPGGAPSVLAHAASGNLLHLGDLLVEFWELHPEAEGPLRAWHDHAKRAEWATPDPIAPPDPIQAIEFHMERLGLSRRDLEAYIGSRARVSEILNRRRSLTLAMIRRLQKGLSIPAATLLQPYPLAGEHLRVVAAD